ncbi:hypothetical protein, partial [Actinoallomurus acaciae]
RPTAGVDPASAVRQWWLRAASISASRYFDPRLCGLNQPPAIWLLGGGAPRGETERTCAVPANRPILAPVANYSAPADGPRPTPPAARMDVTLDGRSLTPIRVTNSGPYVIASAVPGNPVEFESGERVVDDGWWVLIDPGLAPGRHRLDIRVSGASSRLWTLVVS